MNENAVRLIINFKNFIDNGGDWTLISGVNPDMSLIVSKGVVGTFNLYSFIEERFRVRLNALNVDAFLRENALSSPIEDDEPTGFLGVDVQYALVSLESGKSIVFEDTERSIGRSRSSADWVIQGNGVSRVHCFISLVNGSPVIRDNGSTNGVFVNGSRVTSPRVLSEGDKVLLAVSELEVRCVR